MWTVVWFSFLFTNLKTNIYTLWILLHWQVWNWTDVLLDKSLSRGLFWMWTWLVEQTKTDDSWTLPSGASWEKFNIWLRIQSLTLDICLCKRSLSPNTTGLCCHFSHFLWFTFIFNYSALAVDIQGKLLALMQEVVWSSVEIRGVVVGRMKHLTFTLRQPVLQAASYFQLKIMFLSSHNSICVSSNLHPNAVSCYIFSLL